MFDRAAAPPNPIHNRPGGRRSPDSFSEQTFAVADAEVRKLRHDPFELVMRAAQPILWLLLFGR